MIIRSMTVDGFGVFRSARVQQLSPRLTIVVGDNEAGKSTLLGFVRAILFGFPRRTSPYHRPPLNGGRHGGRMELVADDGRVFLLERYAGAHGGPVTVLNDQGRQLGGRDVLHPLLAGATAELFNNIYAFSLDELQAVDSLNGESLRSTIYGAGAGLAGHLIEDAFKYFDTRLSELFKKNASKPLINDRLKQIHAVQAQLRSARDELGQYERTSQERQQLAERIESLREQTAQARQRQHRSQTEANLWPVWIEYRQLQQEAAALEGPFDAIPDDALERLNRFDAQLHETSEQLEHARTERAASIAEIDQILVDQALLDQAETLRELAQRRPVYLEANRQIPALNQRIQTIQAELTSTLTQLGSDWTEEQALAVKRSLAAREAIEQFDQALIEAHRRRERAAEKLDQRREAHHEARHRTQQAEAHLERLASAEPGAPDPELLADLSAGLGQFADAAEERPRLQAELDQATEHRRLATVQINPAWSTDHLDRFDTSLPARQRLESLRRQLDQAGADAHNLRSVAEQAHHWLQRQDHQHEQLDVSLEQQIARFPRDAGPPEQLADAVKTLKSLLRHLENLQDARDHHHQRLADKLAERRRLPVPCGRKTLLSAAGLAVAGFLAAALFVGAHRIPLAVASAGLGAMILAWTLLLQRRMASWAHLVTRLDREIHELRTEIDQAQARQLEFAERVEPLTARLGLPPNPAVDDLEDIEERLARLVRLGDQLDQIQQQRRQARAELERHQVAHRRAEERRERLAARWCEELAAFDLPGDVEPALVARIFEMVERARLLDASAQRLRRRLDALDRRRHAFRDLAFTALDRPDLENLPDAELLTEIERLLAQQQHLAQRREEQRVAQRTLEVARHDEQAARQQVQPADREARAAADAFEALQRQWADWLDQHGLPATFSPQTATGALDRIDHYAYLLDQRAQARRQLDLARQTCDAFERDAAALLQRLDRPARDSHALAAAVQDLEAALDETRRSNTVRDERRRALRTAEARIRNLGDRTARLEARKAHLLAEAGFEDEHRFRRQILQRDQWREKQRALEQSHRNLLSMSGHTDLPTLEHHLRHGDPEAARRNARKAAEQADQLEHQRDHVLRRHAELDQRIKQLEQADRVARLRADEAALNDQLHEASRQWARWRLAQWLLRRACERFEKEQQPAVLHDASTFFKALTLGRYERVIASLRHTRIEVQSPDGRRKTPQQLSRGAVEQLYLALRFGFIRQRGRHGERLPVLMDDILVNFDPQRAQQAAQALHQLAHDHQVILLTCHPQTVETLRRVDPATPLICIQNEQFLRQPETPRDASHT